MNVRLIICTLALSTPCLAASVDERFLEGLRQRRLFALAETYCASRLAESQTDSAVRVTLVVEMARACTEHAFNCPPEQREALWTKALNTIDQFRRNDPSAARGILVDVQQALVHLARGELTRQESELVADPKPRIDEAQRELRLAIHALQSAQSNVADQLKLRNMRRPAADGALEADELASLSRNIDYQLSRAYRNQALTYPPASPDRISASHQAAELLDKLTHGETTDTLYWPARLDEITCLRQMGDYHAAAQRIGELEKSNPPASTAMAARAEEVRLALDVGQVDTALAIAGKSPESQVEPSPQLDAAALEAYLAAWQQTTSRSQQDSAKHWQQRAVETVRHIEQTHAPRWAHQAEALLASRIASSPGTSDVGELVRAAESFYRIGKVDEALATYDKAIEQARANGRLSDAFAPSLAAAAIEQQRKQYAQAAARLRRIALEDPRHAKAAIAHLQAIYDTAQRLADTAQRQANTEPADFGEYVAMLDEHLRLWPSGTTADRARVWLGKVRERGRQWAEAVAAYGGVTSDSEQTTEAIEGVTRCYLAWLSELKSRQQPTEEVATDAATFLESVVTGGTSDVPTKWTPQQRQAALDSAKIWLEFTASGAPRAERILQAALSAEGETSSEWRESARCWLALSLVAQGKHDQAARMLEGLAGGEAAPILSVMEGLERAAQGATPETRQKLAELSLQVAEGLRKQLTTLSPALRRTLDLRTAKALENLGRTSEATNMLKALAVEGTDDPAIQEAYADALIETRETASVKSALAAYRAIEQRSRPGSERWFRAKYGTALAHERLGQHDRAVQIIRVTQLLHPEMGGSAMKAKFDAIKNGR